jgi:hypothetical protein
MGNAIQFSVLPNHGMTYCIAHRWGRVAFCFLFCTRVYLPPCTVEYSGTPVNEVLSDSKGALLIEILVNRGKQL